MKVIEVNRSNLNSFNEMVQKGGAVVKFWADWCGHCKELNPKWDTMTSHLKNEQGAGIIASVPENLISEVDCDSDVPGYPTIRYMVGGKKRKDYNGRREVEDLEKFVKSTLGKGIKKKKKKNKSTRRRKNKTKRRRRKRSRKNKTKKRKNRSRSALRDRFFKMINGNRF
jgi:thioredoxin-like negative regulator of GroEL